MSKKNKLILATAVFGAALFGASCGGGGGTASAPPSPPSPPPGPGVDGQVLALLDVGTASAGPLSPVKICELRSDNKAECGTDLNPTANVDLEYLYEFPNGNVVLKDTSNVLYFFNGSQVIKPDKYRRLGATSDTPAPTGIAIPSGTVTYYATPNFAMAHSDTGELVVVTREGKVIMDSSVVSVNAACEVVTKGTTTYKLNVDGTSSSTTIPNSILTLTSVSGKYLVQDSSNKIYLSNSECSTAGAVEVDTIGGVNDAQMVKVGNDFYIAVRADTSVKYYKVSGSTATTLNTITLSTGGPYNYALDGKGRLYAITGTTTVSVFNIDGTGAGRVSISGVAGLLGLADRALAKNGTNVHQITTTGFTASVADKGSVLYNAVDGCTRTSFENVDGAGTNFIRCVYVGGGNTYLSSLTYDSGSGLYGSANYDFGIVTLNGGLWGTNKALVSVGSPATIYLCNTTTTPTISCNATDLPFPDPTDINSYLKFNGLDVFYSILSSSTLTHNTYTLKVGNVFDPPSALSITVKVPLLSTLPAASGGNASLDLNRFAFSFTPAGAPCATQIAYLSSRTASPKYYTLPSSTCVKRILKVY